MNVQYQLNQDRNSFVSSPISITLLVSMLVCGTEGKTLEELCLALNVDPTKTREMIGYLTNLYKELNNGGVVKITNVILSGPQLTTEYTKQINVYGKCKQINTSDISTLVKQINDYVKTNTKGMIDKIINERELQNVTMVLSNAIYFYSEWKENFKASDTKKREFRGLREVRREELMWISHIFSYLETTKYKLLEMPYNKNNYFFGVILPMNNKSKNDKNKNIGKSNEFFNESESEDNSDDNSDNSDPDNENVRIENVIRPFLLSNEEFKSNLTKFLRVKVEVTIPKFTLESEIDVSPTLKKMGIKKLFTNPESNMFVEKNSTFVPIIKQKVKIIVNEVGTEASASTIGIFKTRCRIEYPPKTYYFTADRPFSYYIRYNDTILFEGIYE